LPAGEGTGKGGRRVGGRKRKGANLGGSLCCRSCARTLARSLVADNSRADGEGEGGGGARRHAVIARPSISSTARNAVGCAGGRWAGVACRLPPPPSSLRPAYKTRARQRHVHGRREASERAGLRSSRWTCASALRFDVKRTACVRRTITFL